MRSSVIIDISHRAEDVGLTRYQETNEVFILLRQHVVV